MRLENIKTFHQRVMMRFLRKRGWVVFYLPKENRRCDKGHFCWLGQYNYEQTRPETTNEQAN